MPMPTVHGPFWAGCRCRQVRRDERAARTNTPIDWHNGGRLEVNGGMNGRPAVCKLTKIGNVCENVSSTGYDRRKTGGNDKRVSRSKD